MSNVKVVGFEKTHPAPNKDNLSVVGLDFNGTSFETGLTLHEVDFRDDNTGIEIVSTIGSSVTFKAAKKMLQDYIDSKGEDETLSVLFGKQQIFSILMQEGCEGLRFYYCRKDNQNSILITGVDKDDNELNTSGTLVAATEDNFPVVKEVGRGKTIGDHRREEERMRTEMRTVRSRGNEWKFEYGLLNDLEIKFNPQQ
jgi:hypothetical protein